MDTHTANIVHFLINNPNYVLIFLVCDPLGNALGNFLLASGTPKDCVTAYLGTEGLVATLYVPAPGASALEARRLVYHSDPKPLSELIWAIADMAKTFGYDMTANSPTREEPMRRGQAWYLRLKDGALELSSR
jgi:hypothetical protein